MPDVWPYWIGTGGTVQPTVGTDAWPYWVTQTTVMCSPPLVTGGQIWQGWINQQPTQALNYTTTVWLNWQTAGTTPIVSPGDVVPFTTTPPTPDQIAQQRRNALITQNRTRARQLRRNIAARKAEQLLLEHLTPRQRDEWTAERAFTVHTADGKRAYKIAYGLAGNVRLVKADEAPTSRNGIPLSVGARFCMHVYHPDGAVPNEDNVLAQKLLIESNERHFLDLANVS